MHEPGRRGVRQVVLRHEVHAPDLDGIEIERARAEIEHALHHERRGRARDAAVRSGRRRVRGHRADLAAIVLELVRAGEQPADHERLDRRRPRNDRVRPRVAEHTRVQRAQAAVGVEAGAQRVVMVARVGARQEVLAARLDPFHGAAQPHREQAQRHVLRIENALHAEAAADVGRDHANRVLRHTERLGQTVTRQVRHLRARPERQLAVGGVPVGHPAAALHRCRRVAVGAKRPVDDRDGAVHREIDAAVLEAAREQHVARRLLVHAGGAVAHGGVGVDGGGQRLIVDVDEHGAVLGGIPVARHDDGHRLAGIARDGPRQDRLSCRHVAGRGGSRGQTMARERLVRTGGDVNDPRRCERARGRDRGERRVGMHAAHERSSTSPT